MKYRSFGNRTEDKLETISLSGRQIEKIVAIVN